jgi:hypothetical protein
VPQLHLIDDKIHTPVSFTAVYASDILNPEKPGVLSVAASNVTGEWVDFAHCRVPLKVTHELVADALRVGWEAWLFGGTGDIRKSVGRVVKMWTKEANM